jgi:hypothetical protein
MNEAMKNAWVEITRALGEPTREDLFLRTWQMAIQAEREACAKVCEEDAFVEQWKGLAEAAKRIRARGNT